MSKKNKILFIFYSVITLGIFLLIVRPKKEQKINTTLSVANKINVDVDDLKQAIDVNNIIGIEHTHSKVKFFVKDRKIIDIEVLKQMSGVSGVYLSSKFVTIIVGPSAELIAKAFKKILSNS